MFRVRMCVSSYGTVVFLAVLRYAQTIRILYLQRRYTGIGVFFNTRKGQFQYKISSYIISYHVAIG